MIQTPYERLNATLRWLENSGPRYTDHPSVILGGAERMGIGSVAEHAKFSYASELIFRQAASGAQVIVKVRG